MLGAAYAVVNSEPVHKAAPETSADCQESVCPTTSVHSTLDLAELESWLAMDANDMASCCRIVPSFSHGHSNGYKLYAIRPRSILDNIGLQNGDTVHKIQGTDVSSLDQSMELYSRLTTDPPDELSIELSRGGCPVTVVLTLIPVEP